MNYDRTDGLNSHEHRRASNYIYEISRASIKHFFPFFSLVCLLFLARCIGEWSFECAIKIIFLSLTPTQLPSHTYYIEIHQRARRDPIHFPKHSNLGWLKVFFFEFRLVVFSLSRLLGKVEELLYASRSSSKTFFLHVSSVSLVHFSKVVKNYLFSFWSSLCLCWPAFLSRCCCCLLLSRQLLLSLLLPSRAFHSRPPPRRRFCRVVGVRCDIWCQLRELTFYHTRC